MLKRLAAAASAALIVLGLAATQSPALPAERVMRVPPPHLDEHPKGPTEVAVLAGGCFWGVQGVYAHVKGVKSAVSGYAGGTTAKPTYEDVSSGTTGHAEAVRVVFDPRQVSYGQLLHIYFSVVTDPTELNRQGPDTGTQYRGALFPASPAQAKIAAAYLDQLRRAKPWPQPIVTTIERGGSFYPAEAHHQDFLTLNPSYPYIVVNDLPKVRALKASFPTVWRAQPVLARS
jgi:peptide-methionine (S)-S-oxide reductase